MLNPNENKPEFANPSKELKTIVDMMLNELKGPAKAEPKEEKCTCDLEENKPLPANVRARLHVFTKEAEAIKATCFLCNSPDVVIVGTIGVNKNHADYKGNIVMSAVYRLCKACVSSGSKTEVCAKVEQKLIKLISL